MHLSQLIFVHFFTDRSLHACLILGILVRSYLHILKTKSIFLDVVVYFAKSKVRINDEDQPCQLLIRIALDSSNIYLPKYLSSQMWEVVAEKAKKSRSPLSIFQLRQTSWRLWLSILPSFNVIFLCIGQMKMWDLLRVYVWLRPNISFPPWHYSS